MFLRKFHTFRTLLREQPTNLKGKKHSSQLWLTRQLKDPYVEKAKQHNYRCRSAFKLLEIHEKHQILQPGFNVVDCGASPGSWTQVAARLTNADGSMVGEEKRGSVIAIDKLPIYHINGATVFGNLDFTTIEAQTILKNTLNGKLLQVVMSDMAPNASGVKKLDHRNIIELAYSAFKFAIQVSSHDATFITKIWDGNMAPQLEKDIAIFYKTVKIIRPQATRDESSEKFILARGFKGLKKQPNKNC